MDDTSSAGDSAAANAPGFFSRKYKNYHMMHQHLLDKATPYTVFRWIIWVLLVIIYGIRVFLLQGWYIVTYALGIYLLNLFIAFLTPKIDPAVSDMDDDDGPSLPTKADEEFRPFMRRLPEFKFWYSAAKAVVIATVCTFFEALNIPVFWPILVVYFIILFTITMKRQIKHMLKYRYIPFTHGKTRYRVEPEQS
ncbi:Protein RER1 [Lamellibrachia satsuma]|nr:Protein RER1 [Lamellibrachia satsuma]